MPSERGTGATRQQMIEAPRGAVFVWVNGHLSYPRDLARSLHRGDLAIVSSEFLRDDRCRGIKREMIVVDHAVSVDYEIYRNLERLGRGVTGRL